MKRTPLLDLLVSMFAASIFVAMICSLWLIEFKGYAVGIIVLAAIVIVVAAVRLYEGWDG